MYLISLVKNKNIILKQSILCVSGKMIQVVFGHWDVVTCLARSESYIGGNCYILSGSRDATLLLWYWNGKTNIIGDNPRGKQNQQNLVYISKNGSSEHLA